MSINLSLYTINRQTLFNWYLFILFVSIVLGLLFWGVRIDNLGLRYHVTASLIGRFVQATFVLIALFIFNPKHQIVRFSLISLFIIIGAVVPAMLFLPNREWFLINTLFSALIGFTIFGSAFYWESMSISTSKLKMEQINRIQMEKTITEAKLRLLQAQIEPHFLFNTLSNILNLFDTDVESGKSMQKDLIHYLESSLDKFRKDLTTIAEEIELVKAYLNIFKVRMGSRLKYSMHIPDDLKQMLIPPMMIQPLVENAIKHGIEPKIEGGGIQVTVEKIDNTLRIIVADTGNGIGDSKRPGIGLTNIRERLELLYGNKARLTLTENSSSGLNAIIEVPYGEKQSRHR